MEGDVPLAAAEEMYQNPVGRKAVRVAGHCGCPPPLEWTTWVDSTGREVLNLKEKAEFERYAQSTSPIMKKIGLAGLANYRFEDDPPSVSEGFVPTYHIDTQEGLNLFVATVRKYGTQFALRTGTL